MKNKAFIILVILTIAISAQAQKLSDAMENAITICENLSKSVYSPSPTPLRAANEAFKAADIVNFGDLILYRGHKLNLDEHFLFDDVFVDSLISNQKVINFASRYAQKRTERHRGSTGVTGRIKLTTLALKAGQSAIWQTVNAGNAEFALVAEPLGLFTMTVKDLKGKVLYAEKKNNKAGEPIRRASIKLPTDKRTTVLIEIKNCGQNDASFALLKN